MFSANTKTGRHEQFVWAGTDNINKVWCVCGAAFDKCEAAINMRRQSNGALCLLPLLVFFFSLNLLLSFGVLIRPNLRCSEVHIHPWAGALSLAAVQDTYLFIYLDLLLVAVVHFLWYTFHPSPPVCCERQHCFNTWFTYLIKEAHALNKKECSWWNLSG